MVRSVLTVTWLWVVMAMLVLPMITVAAPEPRRRLRKKGTVAKIVNAITAAKTTAKTTSTKPITVAMTTTKASSIASTTATTTTSPVAVSTPTFPALQRKIRGVNLGGWFVLEQYMTPSLFTAAQQAGGLLAQQPVDQWTFMTTINNNAKALSLLQQHWSTWIVESDFSQIKSLGFNTVRLPVPHWAYSGSSSEPYLVGAELPYISQAIKLAAKYGLDVILDLHTAPNSQNGYENSGHQGSVGFASTDASDNANRVATALQTMVTTYVNDAQYGGAVKYIEVLNEPLCSALGADYMTYIYHSAAGVINNAISSSALVKPQVMLHDCFISPLSDWAPAVSNGGGLQSTAFMMDTHRYHVFAPRDNMSFQQHIALCHQDGYEIANATNTLQRQIVTGEFSLAVSCTDCPTGATASAATIAKLNRQFFETQTVAYNKGAGWVFWSWKTENDLPWSFKDALAANWIPSNIQATDEAL